MASIRGADLEQMTTLNRRFADEATSVEALQARVNQAISSTAWTGPAAEQFRERWASEFVPALGRLREALSQNATVVEQRRGAIEAATGV
ncbi:MAG: WXG100 family type VII secretion target [Chloroflexi bacterium]|nr:WXG100 family type VII secretion target [Chloroflexota bacterium]MDA1003551.1 WXG100 family type VII secretion target [Chloroflexota bacterium]